MDSSVGLFARQHAVEMVVYTCTSSVSRERASGARCNGKSTSIQRLHGHVAIEPGLNWAHFLRTWDHNDTPSTQRAH